MVKEIRVATSKKMGESSLVQSGTIHAVTARRELYNVNAHSSR